jgi:hypothetical protein
LTGSNGLKDYFVERFQFRMTRDAALEFRQDLPFEASLIGSGGVSKKAGGIQGRLAEYR